MLYFVQEPTFWNLNHGFVTSAGFINHRPRAVQVVKVDMVIAIDDGQFVALQLDCLHGLHSLAILNQPGGGRVVGIKETIHAKVAVVRIVAPVSSIGVIPLALCILGFKSLPIRKED